MRSLFFFFSFFFLRLTAILDLQDALHLSARSQARTSVIRKKNLHEPYSVILNRLEPSIAPSRVHLSSCHLALRNLKGKVNGRFFVGLTVFQVFADDVGAGAGGIHFRADENLIATEANFSVTL